MGAVLGNVDVLHLCVCVCVTHSHRRQEEVKVWGEGLGVSPEEESSRSTIRSRLIPAKHPAGLSKGQRSLSVGWCHLQEVQEVLEVLGVRGGRTAGHLTRDHLKGPRRSRAAYCLSSAAQFRGIKRLWDAVRSGLHINQVALNN